MEFLNDEENINELEIREIRNLFRYLYSNENNLRTAHICRSIKKIKQYYHPKSMVFRVLAAARQHILWTVGIMKVDVIQVTCAALFSIDRRIEALVLTTRARQLLRVESGLNFRVLRHCRCSNCRRMLRAGRGIP